MLFYDPAKVDPEVAKTICKNIRTKMSYCPSSNSEYISELCSSAIHWCVCTQGVCGPDTRFVTPWECGPERPCFESTD